MRSCWKCLANCQGAWGAMHPQRCCAISSGPCPSHRGPDLIKIPLQSIVFWRIFFMCKRLHVLHDGVVDVVFSETARCAFSRLFIARTDPASAKRACAGGLVSLICASVRRTWQFAPSICAHGVVICTLSELLIRCAERCLIVLVRVERLLVALDCAGTSVAR